MTEADINLPKEFSNLSTEEPHPLRRLTRRRSASTGNLFACTKGATSSLFVDNLDPLVTSTQLSEMMENYGPLERVRVLKDCAFVDFKFMRDAVRAKEELDGNLVGIRELKISFKASDDGFSPCKTLWVGNLNGSITSSVLKKSFIQFGQIDSIKVLEGKNCAFINFHEIKSAKEAKTKLNGSTLQHAIIKIRYAKSVSNEPKIRTVCEKCKVRIGAAFLLSCRHVFCEECLAKLKANHEFRLDCETICPICKKYVEGVEYYDGQSIRTRVQRKASFRGFNEKIKDLRRVDLDDAELKEMKKIVDSNHIQTEAFEKIFNQCLLHAVEYSADHLGNTIIQKLIEKSGVQGRIKLLNAFRLDIASLAINKHGTWVIQKLIESCKTNQEHNLIAAYMRPFTVQLLRDQFGNYAIQCCLKLSCNQFIFDAMVFCCREISFSRFGSRSMKSCLESDYTTKEQRDQVAQAIVENAAVLSLDPNGILLVKYIASLKTYSKVLLKVLEPLDNIDNELIQMLKSHLVQDVRSLPFSTHSGFESVLGFGIRHNTVDDDPVLRCLSPSF